MAIHLGMKMEELLEKAEGLKTIETLQEQLKVNRARAIYLVHKLRKQGFVTTKRRSDSKRVYNISPRYAIGGVSYLDIINKYAPLGARMMAFNEYKFHGKELGIEETLIYAIQQDEPRYIIASLALFREIKDWSLLYHLAKKNGLLREIGALYDIARTILRKLRKMPKRFKNLALPNKKERIRYMIKYLNSPDFKNVEKRWKVYVPLSKADLEEYKYGY